MQNISKKRDWGLVAAIFLALLGIIAIFFPYFIIDGVSLSNFRIKIGSYNELGDFIGGVTAPFLSLSAFILLYLTYKSQKQEFQNSRLILKQQNDTLSLQQFETTFFNLLGLHHQITNSIDFDSSFNDQQTEDEFAVDGNEPVDRSSIKLNGRDCFAIYYSLFLKSYRYYSNEEKKIAKQKIYFNRELEIELINNAYSDFFFKHQLDLGHYFRNLYHIIKFIDRSQVVDKQFYASLVRAQLSTFELLLLFYNCLSPIGNEFKPLVETYHLLKNYDINELDVMEHETLYEKSAFGVRPGSCSK